MKHEKRDIEVDILEFIKKAPRSPQALIIRNRVKKRVIFLEHSTTQPESGRLDIHLDTTSKLPVISKTMDQVVSPRMEGHLANSNHHRNFYYTQFDYVGCPFRFSHMNKLHVAVYTNLDPPSFMWQCTLTLTHQDSCTSTLDKNTDPFTKTDQTRWLWAMHPPLHSY